MDWERNLIRARLAVQLPAHDRLEELLKLKAELSSQMNEESLPKHLYWHQNDQGPYCHYIDLQGNDWIGWQNDTQFQWVLEYQGTFWAREKENGRWLGYYNGNWWWKGSDDNNRLCLYRDGTYYLCDADGNVVDPKGERPGELKGDYGGPYQGDTKSGQVYSPAPGRPNAVFHPHRRGSYPLPVIKPVQIIIVTK